MNREKHYCFDCANLASMRLKNKKGFCSRLDKKIDLEEEAPCSTEFTPRDEEVAPRC